MDDAIVPLPDIQHQTNDVLRNLIITTDEIADIIKICDHNRFWLTCLV